MLDRRWLVSGANHPPVHMAPLGFQIWVLQDTATAAHQACLTCTASHPFIAQLAHAAPASSRSHPCNTSSAKCSRTESKVGKSFLYCLGRKKKPHSMWRFFLM